MNFKSVVFLYVFFAQLSANAGCGQSQMGALRAAFNADCCQAPVVQLGGSRAVYCWEIDAVQVKEPLALRRSQFVFKFYVHMRGVVTLTQDRAERLALVQHDLANLASRCRLDEGGKLSFEGVEYSFIKTLQGLVTTVQVAEVEGNLGPQSLVRGALLESFKKEQDDADMFYRFYYHSHSQRRA